MPRVATTPTRLKAVASGDRSYWTTTWRTASGRRACRRFGNAADVPYGEALDSYQKWLETWHTDAGVRDPGARSTLTVAGLVKLYMAHARTYYLKAGEETGEIGWLESATDYLTRCSGRVLTDDYRPAHLKEVREMMIFDRKARKAINARINRIRRVFKWGVEMELVRAETWQALLSIAALKRGRSEARESPPVKPVPDAHVDKTRPHLLSPVRAMVDLQRLTAMRPSEACIMRACDLNTVGDVWLYTPSRHKTEHHEQARVIPLGPKAQAIVRPFLGRAERRLDAYLFDPRDARAEMSQRAKVHRHQAVERPKTRRKVGDRYNKNTYRRAVERACIKAKVTPWHPNQLRHSCLTEFRKRYGLEPTRAAGGHSSVDTTEIYAEIDLAMAVRIAREVG